MSCLRANPLTGEMIDGDVVFDAGFIRYWKQQYALLVGQHDGRRRRAAADAAGHRRGGQPDPGLEDGLRPAACRAAARDRRARQEPQPDDRPSSSRPTRTSVVWELARNLPRGSRGFCQFQTGFQRDFGLAAIALADGDGAPTSRPPSKDKTRTSKDKAEPKKPEPKDELPEEFLGQAIKHIVMHEVGHSLGPAAQLQGQHDADGRPAQRHDDHARQGPGRQRDGLQPDQHRPQGQEAGRLLLDDDRPLRLLGDRVRLQADRRRRGDRAQEDRRPGARARPGLRDRRRLVLERRPLRQSLGPGLRPVRVRQGADRAGRPSSSRTSMPAWSRTANRGRGPGAPSRILLEQWGDGATLASQYVGGQSVSRDHKADKDARDPIVPVPGAKQRECLKFLSDSILADKAFQFSPALLRRLGTERWIALGHRRLLSGRASISRCSSASSAIQKIVLGHCLSPATLARLENQQLQADPGTDPLRMDEVFRSLTDGIWSDLDRLSEAGGDKSAKVALSTIRRNLQREYLRRLSNMVLGSSAGSDGDLYGYVVFVRGGNARCRPTPARWPGCTSRRSPAGSARCSRPNNLTIDDTSRAHLEECRHRIAKVLEANLDVREP